MFCSSSFVKDEKCWTSKSELRSICEPGRESARGWFTKMTKSETVRLEPWARSTFWHLLADQRAGGSTETFQTSLQRSLSWLTDSSKLQSAESLHSSVLDKLTHSIISPDDTTGELNCIFKTSSKHITKSAHTHAIAHIFAHVGAAQVTKSKQSCEEATLPFFSRLNSPTCVSFEALC